MTHKELLEEVLRDLEAHRTEIYNKYRPDDPVTLQFEKMTCSLYQEFQRCENQ